MKIVFVTGVSKGLGQALSQILCEYDDVKVIGIGRRDGDKLLHRNYQFHYCDLEKTTQLEAIIEPLFIEAKAQQPSFVCLINNAAAGSPIQTVGNLGVSECTQSLSVNLIAPLALSNSFCRKLKGITGGKKIINISSGAAELAVAGIGVYCVAKAGLEMLTRILAEENQDSGFSCIAIRPGLIDTDMQTLLRKSSHRELPSVELFKSYRQNNYLSPPETIARKIVTHYVFKRVTNGKVYSL